MQINLTFDSSTVGAPAGFQAAALAAAQYFMHVLSDNITVNITVGYGLLNGQPVSAGALAQSEFFLGNDLTYSDIKQALNADGTSVDDRTSVATLPVNDPTNGGVFDLTSAAMKALGLSPANDPSVDGYIALNSSYAFTYDPNARIVSLKYDAIGTLEHEISEVLGRIGSLGQGLGQNVYEPIDLFRYSSANNRSVAYSSGNFSVNGTSMLFAFNDPNNGGDAADWAAGVNRDSFGYGTTGTGGFVSQTDMRAMDVIGYSRRETLNDFNGDGTSDLIWRNTSSGQEVMWGVQGKTALTSSFLGGDANWRIVGTGDFNGDFTSDVLWRNSTTGTVVMWTLNGGTVVSAATVGGDLTWSVAGTGDFNGDGKSDILWRSTGGTLIVWDMNGTVSGGSAVVGTFPSRTVIGTGDFNGDGKTDILMRNVTTGNVSLLLMNNGAITSTTALGGDTDWSINQIADFNGDGMSDVLWRQSSTGAVFMKEMNGSNVIASQYLGGDLTWAPVGVGDVLGNGNSAIIWGSTSGAQVEWQMNGTQIVTQSIIGNSTSWQVQF